VRYERGGEEFGRVLAFSDGLFAIAMTLLVVGIVVPKLTDGDSVSDLADALNDLIPNFVSFFISFAVIGRYWLAHHEFIGRLKAMDNGLIGLNLVYLGFIAFLPFPTALLGNYFENPLSVATYAVTVGLVSTLEVVMFRHAHRRDLMSEKMPEDMYRFGVVASLAPVLFFVISIPLAFLHTGLAVASWYLVVPFDTVVMHRFQPEGAEQYY
jgi:TMEM175 potassium channel family protein